MKPEISFSDKKIIEKIVPVKQWNAETNDPFMKIKVKYGYVMPLFHGYDWKPTKKQLIRKYTFANV